MTYKDQIKSPKWQKRRLEVMEKDSFTCQICGSTEKTLNVHHLCYYPNRNIWEYDDWELITLCEECHFDEHRAMKGIFKEIAWLKKEGLTLHEIKSYLVALHMSTFCGIDDKVENTNGKWSGVGRNNDLKLLGERRHKFKESYMIKIDNLSEEIHNKKDET